MGKYEEIYSHEGWIVRFSGRLHTDGTWDDSADLEFHDAGTVRGVPLIGNNKFAYKDEAIRVTMTFARQWIDSKGMDFLNEKRQQEARNYLDTSQ